MKWSVLGFVAVGLAGLLAGACQFGTEFLVYTRCERAADCDPASGEAREPLDCVTPRPGGEDESAPQPGYCVHTCARDADCPSGEDDFASLEVQCIEVKLTDGAGWRSECVITCSTENEGTCPDRMRCGDYLLKDGENIRVCFPSGA